METTQSFAVELPVSSQDDFNSNVKFLVVRSMYYVPASITFINKILKLGTTHLIL